MSEENSSEESEVKEEIVEPTGWVKCPVCGEVISTKGKFVHFMHKHGELSYNEYRDSFTPAPPPPTVKTPKHKEGPLYKGETDANEILEEILRKHPDISDKVREEVIDWGRLKGFLQPMEVQAILQSMKGVSAVTANIIASKYSFALMKAQTEGRLMLPTIITQQPNVTPQNIIFPQLQPQQQPTQIQIQPPIQVQPQTQQIPQPQVTPQPYQTPWVQPTIQYPQPLIEDRIKQMIREEMERLRAMFQPSVEKKEEEYIEIEEPLKNQEGKVIVGSDDKPIVRKLKVPISHYDKFKPQEDSEEKLLNKLKLYQEIFGFGKLTPDDIRRIVKEELSSKTETGEKITKEEIVKIIDEITSKQVQATSEQIQRFIESHIKVEEEEKKWKNLIDTIKEEFKNIASSKAVEGYQDDVIRLFGHGLSEIAGTIRERKPIEIILKEAPRLLIPQPQEITGKVGEPKITELLPKELVE